MVKNLPVPERFLIEWLKAGVIHSDGSLEKTELGIPQGSAISPLLSNIVLDGLAEEVKDCVKHLKRRRPTHWSPQVNVIC